MEENFKPEFRLLDTLPDPVLISEDGRITFENEAAKRLLMEELTGLPAGEVFGRELMETETGTAAGTLRLGRGTYAVHMGRRGDMRVYTLRAQPEDSDASRRALGLFTGSIRSGVGTALAAISLMHDRLSSAPAGFGAYVARSDKSACIMARMADNFARAFCGMDAEPHPVPLELRSLVEDLTATVSLVMEEGQPTVVCRHGGEPIPVMADGRLLELALMQLLNNAIKYSGPGSTVTVSIKKGRSSIGITVSDDGRGVRPELLGEIFTSYASPVRDLEPAAGAGLGLGIVQRIAAMHGGSAVMESVYGRGASVTLSFPRIPPTPRATRLRSDYKNDVSTLLIQLSDVLAASVYEKREFI